MKAPLCRACGKWTNVGKRTGVWIQFKKLEETEDLLYGHPEGLEMFCSEHSWLGFKYGNLSWYQSEPLIRAAIANNDMPPKSFLVRGLGKIFKLLKKGG